ncbi:hypothetical protein KIPB_006173 [Kipferlia bialata]|uniref:RING-type domain-containing protein n=1 Tax=Kipferlia bialata TaxID=797122 RepID=A0A9K3CYH2_9EUKA|nr:hypothetical protein KIPB_006173 [Kipferlia bialata]|eukprot:g6173.t1
MASTNPLSTPTPVKHIVSSADMYTPTRSHEQTCPVCHEGSDFVKGPLVSTPCGHTYHRPCLQRWLKEEGDEGEAAESPAPAHSSLSHSQTSRERDCGCNCHQESCKESKSGDTK